MTRSLRSRLILGMFVGMTVLLVVAGATIYTVQRRQLYRPLDESLLSSATALTLLVHRGPPGYWFDSLGLERLSAGLTRRGALFQIWSDQPLDILPPRRPEGSAQERPGQLEPPPGDRQPPEEPLPDWEPRYGPPPPPLGEDSEGWPKRVPGEQVIRSPALNEADLPRLDTPTNQPRFEWITMPDQSRGRAVALRVQLPMHGPGPRRDARSTLVAVVAAGTADIDKQLSFLAVLLVATAVGTMAVSGGVAWLVVSRGLRPLVTVAGEIAALDETGLKNRIADRHVPREIEPVVHQLNALLGRLDEAFDRERSLTADVAHELRTPVAEIRTIADITLSRSREPDAYCQALGDIADTTKALQGLIEKLLVLARLEAGHVKPEMESVPLKSAIVEQWALVHPTAKAKGITLDDRCGPEVLVAADPQLLDMAVGNALSNAADYAANGSTVIVEAKRGEARCELSVANSGCRLSNSEVALVFERFWRADAARSRSGLHCGLGLTLVRRAMEAMGGKADAAVDGGDWFILTLTFPAA